ncbi:MAG: hypothetical protein QOG94_3507 [Solirubrobacteraceae bacterium]|nr:hypothetical protein [Solirubrobacteraceae bacterium]
MTTRAPQPRRDPERRTYRVRLPGFVSDEDIGLGDVITKSTSALGIRPCGGCGERSATLNRWVVFGRGRMERGH